MLQKRAKTVNANNAENISTRLIQYCDSRLVDCKRPQHAVDLASVFLFSRIVEFSRAALTLAQTSPLTPVAMAVLLRAQLETASTFSAIFGDTEDSNEHHDRATRFIRFAEYQHVSFFEREGDRDRYRETLTAEEKKNFDRRIETKTKISQELSKKNKSQRFPTWNGESITATICKTHGSHAGKWYASLSLIAHGDPSMLHKSVTIDENQFVPRQQDCGHSEVARWLKLMNRQLFVAMQLYLCRSGRVEIDDECQELGRLLGIEGYAS